MARVKNAPVKQVHIPKQSGKCWARVLKVYKSVNAGVVIPRKRPGEYAPRESDRYKTRDDEILLKRAPFARLIKEISQANHPGFRYQTTAIEALRTVAEHHIVQIFADAKLCAKHAERNAVTAKDLQLACRLTLK